MDGSGSLLDADTLDGIDSTAFLRGTRYHFSGANGNITRTLPSFGHFYLFCTDGALTVQFQNVSGGNVTLWWERAGTNQLESSVVANLGAPVIVGTANTADRFTVRVANASRSVAWDAWVIANLSTCTFDLTEIDQS